MLSSSLSSSSSSFLIFEIVLIFEDFIHTYINIEPRMDIDRQVSTSQPDQLGFSIVKGILDSLNKQARTCTNKFQICVSVYLCCVCPTLFCLWIICQTLLIFVAKCGVNQCLMWLNDEEIKSKTLEDFTLFSCLAVV